jgi:hypothetical protein
MMKKLKNQQITATEEVKNETMNNKVSGSDARGTYKVKRKRLS